VTTEPAPIVEPSPTFAITTAAAPIQQLAPISTTVNAPSSAPEISPARLRACCRPPLRICTPEAICVRAPIAVFPKMQYEPMYAPGPRRACGCAKKEPKEMRLDKSHSVSVSL